MSLRVWRAEGVDHSSGIFSYDRAVHLPRILPDLFWRDGAAALAAMPGDAIIARLEAALAREAARARLGHWRYDMARHLALAQALSAERRRATTEPCREPPGQGRGERADSRAKAPLPNGRTKGRAPR